MLVFLVVLLLMVMRRERGQESKNNKKREGSKRARQVPIHSLTPDRPPLAATTMLYYRQRDPNQDLSLIHI